MKKYIFLLLVISCGFFSSSWALQVSQAPEQREQLDYKIVESELKSLLMSQVKDSTAEIKLFFSTERTPNGWMSTMSLVVNTPQGEFGLIQKTGDEATKPIGLGDGVTTDKQARMNTLLSLVEILASKTAKILADEASWGRYIALNQLVNVVSDEVINTDHLQIRLAQKLAESAANVSDYINVTVSTKRSGRHAWTAKLDTESASYTATAERDLSGSSFESEKQIQMRAIEACIDSIVAAHQ